TTRSTCRRTPAGTPATTCATETRLAATRSAACLLADLDVDAGAVVTGVAVAGADREVDHLTDGDRDAIVIKKGVARAVEVDLARRQLGGAAADVDVAGGAGQSVVTAQPREHRADV